VSELAMASMAEIELGRLATQKGMNAQVKRFAQMMIDDHTKAGDKLKAAVASHNLMLPTQIDQEHQAVHDRLSKLQGAEFDREYAAAMVEAHQDVSDKLESRVDEANLADWKAKFGVGNNTANTTGNNPANAPAQGTEHGQMGTVMPEKSDNVVTTAINQWAAESYPVVQMHLASARTLNDTLEKSGRNAR
jgi:putative membrane protein